MKSYLITFLFLIFSFFFLANAFSQEFVTTTGGNWTDDIWSPPGPPTSGSNVTINHNVNLNTSVTDINDVTIKDDAGTRGILNISGTTHQFSITGNLVVEGSDETTMGLSLSNTVINLGDEIEDGVYIKGGANATANSTLNVAGFLYHVSGRLTIDGASVINVNNANVREDTTKCYFVGTNATFKLANGPEATIIVKNGNKNAPEVYIEQTTPGYADEFEIHFNLDPANASQDNTYELVSNYGFRKVYCNLIETGNTLTLKPIATDVFTNLQYNEIQVASGVFEIGRMLRAEVNTNFMSTTTQDLLDNGYMYVVGDLNMVSNIAGDGIVVAGTYTMNGNSVFGIPGPVNEEKYSSATWTGNGDGSDWNDAGNWSQNNVPHGNTSVIIKNGGQVSIGPGGSDGNAAVIEIETGCSLTVNDAHSLIVGFYGILSGGALNIDGGVSFGTDLDVQSGGSVNVNTGSLKIGP